jgi:eukaryotic-like serine/threonine-protein kinase
MLIEPNRSLRREEAKMQVYVTLTMAVGNLTGQRFVFSGPGQSVIGRAKDCAVQLQREPWQLDISRHHCVVVIDQLGVLVRDLGSLNGTFVNGRLIGKRRPNEPAESSSNTDYSGQPLQHGDQIQVGDIVFSVAIRELQQAHQLQQTQSGESCFGPG